MTHPAFAQLIADTAPPTLHNLIQGAIDATDHASFTLNPRDEDVAYDARERLAHFLQAHHQITPDLARQMHKVLPS